jgi:aldose 1-epimerase
MSLSGEQIAITSGTQRIVVTTVGATLRAYEVGDRAVIDGFGPEDICADGRGQILMPWPNRIADGRYELSGIRQQLPLDEPKLGHAIHGLVRWAEWRVEEQASSSVSLRHRLCARPGYPFPIDLFVQYRLSPAGLAVTFTATNIGMTSCPFGAGAHPYFTFAGANVDAVELCVRANDWLEMDARSIPRGRLSVEGRPIDFRRPRVIDTAKLDHPFTNLERDREGLAQVILRHRNDEIRIWQDRSFDFVQVYTGDTLPNQARRRQGVAVEPMSCAPNAFNSGDGLRMLAPGESFTGRWGVAVQVGAQNRELAVPV